MIEPKAYVRNHESIQKAHLYRFCQHDEETPFDPISMIFYNAYARNRDFSVRRKRIDKPRRPPNEVICKKFCCKDEGVKKLSDKRKDGLTVNSQIDTRVECPTEMHVRLRLLSRRRF